MIVTVTLNPSIDKTFSTPQLRPGNVHRMRLMRQDLGGKGINVSRALRMLGLGSKIVGIMAGNTGQALQNGLLAAKFDCHFMQVDGDTRQNITLLDEATGQYTKFNEPGPVLSYAHVAALETTVDKMVRPGDLWAFGGSLPPGAPNNLYARLIQRVQAGGGRAFLDTSGPALKEGLTARPYAINPNAEEMTELLQLPLHNAGDYCEAAHRLQTEGVSMVALSLGARGMALAVDGEMVLAKPPPVVARSPVGAGDAALAGLLWAVSDGCNPVEIARRAVACGTAAAMQEGTGLGNLALVTKLLAQITLDSDHLPPPFERRDK